MQWYIQQPSCFYILQLWTLLWWTTFYILSILNASFFTKINSRSGISKSKVMIYVKVFGGGVFVFVFDICKVLTHTYCYTTIDKTCQVFLGTHLEFVLSCLWLRIHHLFLNWYVFLKPLPLWQNASSSQGDCGFRVPSSSSSWESNCRRMGWSFFFSKELSVVP